MVIADRLDDGRNRRGDEAKEETRVERVAAGPLAWTLYEKDGAINSPGYGSDTQGAVSRRNRLTLSDMVLTTPK